MLNKSYFCILRISKSLALSALVLSVSIDARAVDEVELEAELEKQIQEDRNKQQYEDESGLEDFKAPTPINESTPHSAPCMDFPFCPPNVG